MPDNPLFQNIIGRGEIKPYEPGLRDRIGNVLFDAAVAMGLGGQANRMRNDATAVVDFIPGVGDAVGVDDTINDYQRGDYLGAAVNGGATAIGAVPGVGDLGAGALKAIFAGIGAKTADRAALMAAQDMADAGSDPKAIWDQTGWFKGADDRWRFEIDDSVSPTRMRPDEKALFAYPEMRQFIEHPALYEAYPDLGSIRLAPEFGKANGTYSVSQDVITLQPVEGGDMTPDAVKARHSTALHELQHGVQTREGFGRGASVSEYDSGPMFSRKAKDLSSDLSVEIFGNLSGRPHEILDLIQYVDPKRIDEIVSKHGFESPKAAVDYLKKQNEMRTPYSQYRRTSGEVEARNVQTRRNMSAAERRALPPWETEDVARGDQIVRR